MSASVNISGVAQLDDGVVRDFERIYREQVAYVLKLLLRFGLPRTAAEDLAHDVFEVLFLRLALFAPEERRNVAVMRAFLFRTATNRVSNYRRLHAVKKERTFEEPPEVESASQAHEHVLARELGKYLAKLSAQQLAVFVGFEVLGMTAPEIASEQCIKERDVRAILDEARVILRRSVNPPTRRE